MHINAIKSHGQLSRGLTVSVLTDVELNIFNTWFIMTVMRSHIWHNLGREIQYLGRDNLCECIQLLRLLDYYYFLYTLGLSC